MKNVTIFEVSTHSGPKNTEMKTIHLVTLSQGEAETHARGIAKTMGGIPDIFAGEFAPVDHTTAEARAEKAARTKAVKTIETRLAEGAAKVRAAREAATSAKA